jgi:hypothetical protein
MGEGGEEVLLGGGLRPAVLSASGAATGGILSFSSTTRRSAVFLPTPGTRVRRAMSLPRRAAASSAASMPERMFTASLGPTPRHLDEPLEEVLLVRGEEAEEGQGVLAHVGVHAQAHLAPFLAQAIEGRDGDGHAVARRRRRRR